MIFDILTLFPDMLLGPLQESILGKAVARGLVEINIVNIRDYATDKHQTTDDRPYGGGSGMVMKPEPLVRAIRQRRTTGPPARAILLSPQGRTFTQALARELQAEGRLILICGRYEGVDERVRAYVDDEISIGDYVLTGGELAALVVVDAVSRLIPGVLGNEGATEEESFTGFLLEYPQYTRPVEFEGKRAPQILLSGNHGAIKRWRRQQALLRTWKRRPDLLDWATLSHEDRQLLLEALQEDSQPL